MAWDNFILSQAIFKIIWTQNSYLVLTTSLVNS